MANAYDATSARLGLPLNSCHIPVLLEEVIEQLALQPGQTIIDGTLGGGGHTRRIAQVIGQSGRAIAFDRDPAAIAAAETSLAGMPVELVHGSYTEIPRVLEDLQIDAVDGILLDLGLSSDQLADDQRGFSFDTGGELDLRFDPTTGEPAWKLLQRLKEETIADIIYEFGEERFSRRIARKIVETRRSQPIRTAADLARLVRSCVPRGRRQNIDPATRTFQALRIAVNQELQNLDKALQALPDCLRIGGRLAIISFHSLEDRRVKNAFRDDSRLDVLTKKPVTASIDELATNPRSRSAKLRVAARLA